MPSPRLVASMGPDVSDRPSPQEVAARYRLRPGEDPQWIRSEISWGTRSALRMAAAASGVSVDVFVGIQLEAFLAEEDAGGPDSVDSRLSRLPISLASDPKVRRWQRHLMSKERDASVRDELPEVVVPARLGSEIRLNDAAVVGLLEMSWTRSRQLEVTAAGLNLTIAELVEQL